jgi:chemotaxis protein MotB
MKAPHPEIVIVRRRGSHEDEPHGGAWKIAFADFMTAMMAFFLVLWIISATDKNTKTLIARYFNPVRIEEPAKAQKGIHGTPVKDANPRNSESVAPSGEKLSSGHGEIDGQSANEGAKASAPTEGDQRRPPPPQSAQPPADPAKPYPTMSEHELFTDPRASLEKIAGAPAPGPRIDPSAALKGYGEVGPSADEALRDPFRPLGSDKAVNVASPDAGAPPATDAASAEPAPKSPSSEAGATDAARAEPAPKSPSSEAPAKDAASAEPAPKPRSSEAAAREDAKIDLVPPAPKAAESQATESPTAPAAVPPAAAAAEARQAAAASLLADLRKRLGGEAQAIQGPRLEVQATEEGLLISLTDRENFSMFPIGSAEPQARVVHMMDTIAARLQNMPGAIIVRGHTDARPYRSATYDNWRLSSARAQIAYYMLSRGGLAEKRFERIEGFADHHLKDPAHPLAAENRRIEILLREVKP